MDEDMKKAIEESKKTFESEKKYGYYEGDNN